MRLAVRLVLVLAALAAAFPGGGEAATKIFTSADVGNSTGQAITGYYGQRKLVRDADGYWYAVVGGLNAGKCEVIMKKSTDTAGTAWSSKTVLCGSGGIIYNSTSYNFRFPSIDIDRKNGKIHLVFQLDNDILYYSKLVNLSSWTSSANWKNVQESATGYQQLVSAADCFYETSSLPRYGHGIALDSSGNPHIAYSRKPSSGSSYNKPYYLYGSTSGGWNSEVNLNAADVDQRFPAVEVDSTDCVHYLVQYGTRTVYSYSDSANLKYRHTSDITGAWGGETNIDASYDCNWVELALDFDNTIHLVCQEEDGAGPDDLIAYSWNNSAWTSEGILETDLQYDANGTYEAFALTTFPPAATAAGGSVSLQPLLGLSTASSSTQQYSTWDGSDFSNAASGPVFASYVDWIVVESTATGKMVAGVTYGDGTDGTLYASFFDGSSIALVTICNYEDSGSSEWIVQRVATVPL